MPGISARRAALRIAMIAMLALPLPSPAQRTVTVLTESLGIWDGWGTSLAWWGKGIGRSAHEDTYADLLYTMRPVRFGDRTLPGLGLNIVRYNIGGGGLPTDDVQGRVDAAPPAPAYPPDRPGDDEKQHQLAWFRDIDGYWIDWFSRDPASASWDWRRDANQRSMLRAIHRRGATVEFFSNAPMWWMTRNDPDDRTLPSNQNLPRRANGTPFAATCRKSAVDNACKSSAGGTLQSWNAGDYAYYLATVVAQARRHWGIRVASIAPFNEPMAADDYQTNEYGERSWYWRYPARQEGVHLEIGQQATILRALRNELDRWGLHDVVIAASDENNAPHAKETFEGLAGLGVADLIGRINVHSYGYSTGKVNPTAPPHDHKYLADALLREAVGNRRVWVSEYGNCEDPTTPCDFANPWDESTNGSLATAILTDLDHLKPSAWLYWQAVEFGDATYTSRWGLVNGAFGREEDATSPYRGTPSYVNNKYFVFAQFTRFLRPGFERLVTRQSRVPVFDVINRSVAAYDRRGGKLVLIWDNRWGPDSVKFDLSAMGPIGCRVASVTATRHDGTMQFHRTTTLVTGNTLTIAAEAGTLYSIVVPGVELSRHARGRDSSDGSGHRSKRTRTDCSVHLDDEDEHGAKRHGHDH